MFKAALLTVIPAFTAAMTFAAATASAATAVVAPPPASVMAALNGDPVAGKTVFNACRMCHAVAPDRNGIGPSLHGVVGRAAGSVASYTYSTQLKTSRIVWTEPVLNQFLVAPQAYVPGTKMAYAGLKDAQKRADLIAYLKTKPLS